MITIAKNKRMLIIVLMILIIVFCSMKLIPRVKEYKREKQEIPLTQNFIDTFHENFEYGMTDEEIKDKLGEPYEIWDARRIKRDINENRNLESYEDYGDWYKFAEKIQRRKGYERTPGYATQRYRYKIDIDGFCYATFSIRDGYFVAFRLE